MLVRGTPTAAGAELRQPAPWNESSATKSPGFGAWLRKQTSAETTSEVVDQRTARSAVDEDVKTKNSAAATPTAQVSADAEEAAQTRESMVTTSRALVTKTSAEKSAKAGVEAGVEAGAKADAKADAEKKQAIKQGVARGNVPRSQGLSASSSDKRRVGNGREHARSKFARARGPSDSAQAKVRSSDEVTTKVALRKAEAPGVHTQGSSKKKEALSQEATRRDEGETVDHQIPSEKSAVQGDLTAGSSRAAHEGTGNGAPTALKETSTKADSSARVLKRGDESFRQRNPSGGEDDNKVGGRMFSAAEAGKEEQAEHASDEAEKISGSEQIRLSTKDGGVAKATHFRAAAQVADSKGPSAPVDTGRVSTTPVRVDVSTPDPSAANSAPLRASPSFHQLVEQGINQLLASPQGSLVRQLNVQLAGGGQADIRLSLQPESLGAVRLHVQLTEGHAATQIRVENAQTAQLMEGALESFARGFSDNGYQQQRFEVVVEQRRAVREGASEGASSSRAQPLAQVWFDQQHVNYMA